MSRWFGGGKKQNEASAESAAAAAAPDAAASGSAFGGEPAVSGRVLGGADDAFRPPGELLASAGVASSSASSSRLYNPYSGLSGGFDPAISRTLMEVRARAR